MDESKPDPAHSTPERSLSGDLKLLAKRSKSEEIKVRDIGDHLGPQGSLLTIFFLNLPFIIPLSIPGVSSVLGAAIVVLAGRMILGKKSKPNGKLANKVLPKKFFPSLLGASAKVLGFFEKFLRPRLPRVTRSEGSRRIHLALILLAALILLLPLPIPLSNFLPGISILLITGGLLERDGLSVILGYLVFILGAAFVILASYAGVGILDKIKTWLAFW